MKYLARLAVGVAAASLAACGGWQNRGEIVQEQAVGGSGVDRCILRDILTARNEHGYVAIIRDVNCPEPLAQGTGYFAVFVHRAGADNTKRNLAFQYEPGFLGQAMSGPPRVAWLPDGSLQISESGPIEELDKQLNSVNGIRISYMLTQAQSQVDRTSKP